MTRRIFAIALVISLASGCTSSPETPSRAPVAAVAKMELPFWVSIDGDDLPADAHEHPCGAYVTRLVERIPTAEDGPLDAEWIVEFDADGRELSRWPAPVDFMPEAIDGERLQVADGKLALRVETDGRFEVVTPINPDLPRIDCPEIERFEGSDYLQCTTLRDASTGADRRIAFEGVCT